MDSRKVGKFIRRRRECLKCHERFSTVEARVPQTVSVQSVMNGFEALLALKGA